MKCPAILATVLIPTSLGVVGLLPHIHVSETQIECLVRNAFYEAFSEGRVGRQQVTQVVFNRAANDDFCKVIYAPYQFSWTLKKQKPVPQDVIPMLRNEVLAVYYKLVEVPYPSATHYHNQSVSPSWGGKLKMLGAYRAHTFYAAHPRVSVGRATRRAS